MTDERSFICQHEVCVVKSVPLTKVWSTLSRKSRSTFKKVRTSRKLGPPPPQYPHHFNQQPGCPHIWAKSLQIYSNNNTPRDNSVFCCFSKNFQAWPFLFQLQLQCISRKHKVMVRKRWRPKQNTFSGSDNRTHPPTHKWKWPCKLCNLDSHSIYAAFHWIFSFGCTK